MRTLHLAAASLLLWAPGCAGGPVRPAAAPPVAHSGAVGAAAPGVASPAPLPSAAESTAPPAVEPWGAGRSVGLPAAMGTAAYAWGGASAAQTFVRAVAIADPGTDYSWSGSSDYGPIPRRANVIALSVIPPVTSAATVWFLQRDDPRGEPSLVLMLLAGTAAHLGTFTLVAGRLPGEQLPLSRAELGPGWATAAAATVLVELVVGELTRGEPRTPPP